ncbi:ParB/RepB/Spo0J family partition protein [Streptococcus ferus]|uniref:SpoJ n=1 Tax=Streptococcus ferus TaxID=1345 RepID=A0A2X3VPE1_9STRE|nr:ParB/RepB/Spo0J family partition protein [Streptococcus ferus]SQF41318.1 SpoJ [Streptococcus ferus]
MPETFDKLNLNAINPNPYQPRRQFNQEALEELAQSIKENGLIQPIIVRKSNILGYELIAGERRWRAAKIAGLEKIPVIIKTISDQDSMKQAIIENLQRDNLNPIEEAKAYQQLLDKTQMTHEELAQIMGKSRPYITNSLRLLTLPRQLQEALEKQQISQGHARLLLNLTKEEQTYWYQQIITNKLSVRQIENHLKQNRKKNPSQKPTDLFSLQQAKELSQLLGLPVQISKNKQGQGQVKISFSSLEDFDRIINSLK